MTGRRLNSGIIRPTSQRRAIATRQVFNVVPHGDDKGERPYAYCITQPATSGSASVLTLNSCPCSLTHIAGAAAVIADYLKSVSKEAFLNDVLRQNAENSGR
jgi:hypothetical protein